MGIAVERNLEIGSDFYRQECDRLREVNAELVAALDRLIFAAECRDNTMGDPSRLIDVKASLVAATVLARSVSFEAKHARAALAKAQAE